MASSLSRPYAVNPAARIMKKELERSWSTVEMPRHLQVERSPSLSPKASPSPGAADAVLEELLPEDSSISAIAVEEHAVYLGEPIGGVISRRSIT